MTSGGTHHRIRLYVDVFLRLDDVQKVAETASGTPVVVLTLPDTTVLEGRLMGGTKIEGTE